MPRSTFLGGCERCFDDDVQTLTACGLEEPWSSQELLIKSVGPVSLICVLCHINPICCFSVELKYITYALTHNCVIHGYKFTDDYYDDDAFDFSYWDNNDDLILYFIPMIEDENELNNF